MRDEAILDTEFAILGLLDEVGPASGYRVLTLVAERGMNEWAGLSASSVYNNLRKLCRSGLAASVPDLEKNGRGPAGSLYSLSAEGRSVLRRHLGEALVHAKEQSPAFKLALAFSGALSAKRLAALLDQRLAVLRVRCAQVEKVRRPLQDSGKEPRSATLLFEYVLQGLAHELRMAEHLAQISINGDKS